MEINGLWRSQVARIVREGATIPGGQGAGLFKNGLVDKYGEPEMKLYFEAIRNEILSVRYVVRVRDARPALILEEARVPDGPVTAGTALSMIEHSIGFGLGGRNPVLALDRSGGGYVVVHR